MNSFLPIRNLCAFSLTLLGILTLSAQPAQSPAPYVPKPLAPSLRTQAETAQFFSFGTNDLTQTALGISRDDMGSFLNAYTENEIFKRNPFATLDQTGVGQLMEIAIAKGRATRPGIKLGICGEHGGDPESVKFCHRIGLSYVSCSPFRVPVARLAAAQAAIQDAKASKKRKG